MVLAVGSRPLILLLPVLLYTEFLRSQYSPPTAPVVLANIQAACLGCGIMVATRSRSQMSSQDGGSEQQGNAEHLEGEVQSHRRTRGSGTGASQAAATRRTTRAALHAIPEQDEAAAGRHSIWIAMDMMLYRADGVGCWCPCDLHQSTAFDAYYERVLWTQTTL